MPCAFLIAALSIRLNIYGVDIASQKEHKQEMGDGKDLYASTPFHLLHLDLKNKQKFDPLSEDPLPEVAVCMEYGHDYPCWMSVVKTSGSKIYLMGGKGDADAEKQVYECNPVEKRLEKGNLCLTGRKADPFVREIEGKIYVLDLEDDNHFPGAAKSFEVLDPCSLTVEVLDNPPCYTRRHKSSSKNGLWGGFVLGHKLYVVSHSYKLYSYDTRRRSWSREKDMYTNVCKDLGSRCDWLIPMYGATVCGGDVVLAFQEHDPLTFWDSGSLGKRRDLYGYVYSKDGCFLGCQNLGNVFSVPLKSTHHYLVFAMEDGKVCALTVGYNGEIPALCETRMMEFESGPAPAKLPFYVLAVSIFRVVKLQDEAPCMPPPHHHHHHDEYILNSFLSLEIEDQYIFRIAGLNPFAFYTGAFFL